MSDEPDFEGYPGRECGEHRTTGGRAWCFECGEWCYPGDPTEDGCKGCAIPQLRKRIADLTRPA